MLEADLKDVPVFQYTPEEYPEDCTLHWCLPFDTPEQRTFTATEYQSGQLHLVDLEYDEPEENTEQSTNERYNSITAARVSRRIKQGPASDCPFCSEKPFKYGCSRLPMKHNFPENKRWGAEVLEDFKQTVISNCRSEHMQADKKFKSDIEFAEITQDQYGNATLEILTNTDSLRYAYTEFALPNWYTLSYAIAQNPWIKVEEVTDFATEHTRIRVSATKPQKKEYEESAYRLLSQRDNAPYETKKP